MPVDRVVEKSYEVPVEKVVYQDRVMVQERIVEKPVEHIVEVPIERIIHHEVLVCVRARVSPSLRVILVEEHYPAVRHADARF